MPFFWVWHSLCMQLGLAHQVLNHKVASHAFCICQPRSFAWYATLFKSAFFIYIKQTSSTQKAFIFGVKHFSFYFLSFVRFVDAAIKARRYCAEIVYLSLTPKLHHAFRIEQSSFVAPSLHCHCLGRRMNFRILVFCLLVLNFCFCVCLAKCCMRNFNGVLLFSYAYFSLPQSKYLFNLDGTFLTCLTLHEMHSKSFFRNHVLPDIHCKGNNLAEVFDLIPGKIHRKTFI